MVSHHKENPGRSALQGLHLWQDQDPNQASTAAPHTCPYQNPTVLVKKGDDEEGANQHHGLRDTSTGSAKASPEPSSLQASSKLEGSPLKWRRRCSISTEEGPSSLGSQGTESGHPCAASGLCYQTPLSSNRVLGARKPSRDTTLSSSPWKAYSPLPPYLLPFLYYSIHLSFLLLREGIIFVLIH